MGFSRRYAPQNDRVGYEILTSLRSSE